VWGERRKEGKVRGSGDTWQDGVGGGGGYQLGSSQRW